MSLKMGRKVHSLQWKCGALQQTFSHIFQCYPKRKFKSSLEEFYQMTQSIIECINALDSLLKENIVRYLSNVESSVPWQSYFVMIISSLTAKVDDRSFFSTLLTFTKQVDKKKWLLLHVDLNPKK